MYKRQAYRATIDYFKTTPGSDKVPAWAAVTSFTNKSEDVYKRQIQYCANRNEITASMVAAGLVGSIDWGG